MKYEGPDAEQERAERDQGRGDVATAWLERMERAGEDTGPAWTRVVSEASPEAAWPLTDGA